METPNINLLSPTSQQQQSEVDSIDSQILEVIPFMLDHYNSLDILCRSCTSLSISICLDHMLDGMRVSTAISLSLPCI